jgi:lysophospholipase L1-like esterase
VSLRDRITSPPRVRGTALGLLVVASLAVGLAAPTSGASVPGRQETARRKPAGTLMVIGDSLSRTFNDKPGSLRQGFWSMLAKEVGARPRLAAQGGAGFVKPGLTRCKGRTFAEQLARDVVRRRVVNADALIIEGGRNDTRTCHGRGFVDVTTEQLRAEVNAFMDQVEALRGGSDDCTIVITPWGPKGPDERRRITPVVHRAAKRHGFHFVDTVGLISGTNAADDGVHPTHSGNVALTDAILRHSFARACFY